MTHIKTAVEGMEPVGSYWARDVAMCLNSSPEQNYALTDPLGIGTAEIASRVFTSPTTGQRTIEQTSKFKPNDPEHPETSGTFTLSFENGTGPLRFNALFNGEPVPDQHRALEIVMGNIQRSTPVIPGEMVLA